MPDKTVAAPDTPIAAEQPVPTRSSETAHGAMPVSLPTSIEAELERTRRAMEARDAPAAGPFRRGGDLSMAGTARQLGALEPGEQPPLERTRATRPVATRARD